MLRSESFNRLIGYSLFLLQNQHVKARGEGAPVKVFGSFITTKILGPFTSDPKDQTRQR
jgi:hypothetical protein